MSNEVSYSMRFCDRLKGRVEKKKKRRMAIEFEDGNILDSERVTFAALFTYSLKCFYQGVISVR